ncbi:hypothetical protein [Enterococcus rivorum]|uniref:hypothetical protein n=1 Tax=Enterococcus rivorum TaxID=762845 RepID=UPI001112CF09|nr:hypothetical protein [Enterococcus rivorum]MBP2100551.1 hypothetical protein [Enterococcus rivorum]
MNYPLKNTFIPTRFIEKYFYSYDRLMREVIQLIVIGKYTPYLLVAKKLFLNTQLIIGLFHIV